MPNPRANLLATHDVDRHYVSCYFIPGQDVEDIIVGFIDRAKFTLDIAVYSMTLPSVTEALRRVATRGVTVRVVMDALQAKGRYSQYKAMQKLAAETPFFSILKDKETGIMHNKFAVCDQDTRYAAVLTGSANWTKGGTKVNRENMMITRMVSIVRAFGNVFQEIYEANW